MLKIRLQRVGRKHEPSFRLVLTDSKNSTKSGKYLETLGNYDARRGEKSEFKTERISYWMSKGAQVSGTVHNLLVDKKVVSGKKVNVLPLKKAIVKEAPAEAAPAPAAAPAPEVQAEAPVEAPAVEETPVA
jgi:small subunit ribosomal protein S16